MIADLLNRPTTQQTLNVWSFANQNHHDIVIDVLRELGNTQVSRYIMDPVSLPDINNFLIRHQQSHNEINDVLGVAGNDLSSVNIRDPNSVESWLLLHFQEHFQWQDQTGVP
jgi:uncharacterized protein (DUF2249 family)